MSDSDMIDLEEAKKELERIDRELEEQTLLIGGLAVQQYCPLRRSKDLDLVTDDQTIRRVIESLYPGHEWIIEDDNLDAYRPSYRIRHRVRPDYPVVYLGPKITERGDPYFPLTWKFLLRGCIPFRYSKTKHLEHIVVPTAEALCVSKALSFLNRADVAPEMKVKQDLIDFVGLSNLPGSKFAANDFFDFIRELDLEGRMTHEFMEKANRFPDVIARSLPVIQGKLFRTAPPGAPLSQGLSGTAASSSAPRINTARLSPPSENFIGRDNELSRLTEAWRDDGTGVLSIVGFGGQGKTSLVQHWLDAIGDDWLGAQQVFCWSFHGQGSSGQLSVDSDRFIDDALTFFGEADESKSGRPQGEHIKRNARKDAEDLAALVRRSRTLLVLDGLEPFQGSENSRYGRIADPALEILVKELVTSNQGLCLITTRIPLQDVQGRRRHSSLELGRLSSDAGIKLLKSLGVSGSESDLRQATNEQRGHALSLTLLGSQLNCFHDGDVRRRLDVVCPPGDDTSEGEHVRRLLVEYARQLGNSEDPNAGAALNVMRVVGLSDGPMDAAAIKVLRAHPIPGLTALREGTLLSDREWKGAVRWLRKASLLARGRQSGPGRGALDAHPMVREYFTSVLRHEDEEAWREGHNRLFEHYRDRPRAKQPKTLQTMMPLFSSVRHGCRAKKVSAAFEEVYVKRIRQEPFGDAGWDRVKNVHFDVKTLGAIGIDLEALGQFFDGRWEKVTSDLEPANQAYLLLYAGLDLRLLGRLQECGDALRGARDLYTQLNDAHGAATACRHLSQALLLLGDLEEALGVAREAKRWLEPRDASPKDRVFVIAGLAHVLHQLGQIGEATAEFDEAARAQEGEFPSEPLLWAIPGFRYCEFLIDMGRSGDALAHAEEVASYSELDDFPYGRYLNSLISVKAARALGEASASRGIDDAIHGLRDAGQQHGIGLAVLERSVIRRVGGDLPRAWDDLGEAYDIAEAGWMNLVLTDVYLESARLHTAESEWRKAEAGCAKVGRMVEHQGYERRKAELGELERHIEELKNSGDRVAVHEDTGELPDGAMVHVIEVDLPDSNRTDTEHKVARAFENAMPELWEYVVVVVPSKGRQTVVLEGEPAALTEIVRAAPANEKLLHQLGTFSMTFFHRGKWSTLRCEVDRG